MILRTWPVVWWNGVSRSIRRPKISIYGGFQSNWKNWKYIFVNKLKTVLQNFFWLWSIRYWSHNLRTKLKIHGTISEKPLLVEKLLYLSCFLELRLSRPFQAAWRPYWKFSLIFVKYWKKFILTYFSMLIPNLLLKQVWNENWKFGGTVKFQIFSKRVVLLIIYMTYCAGDYC